MKFFCSVLAAGLLFTGSEKPYSWIANYDSSNTIATRIAVPAGFKRTEAPAKSFGAWLRNLPVRPVNTPVKLWSGELKFDQTIHCAVVDLDFIGKNLQQCIDAIIRVRAEYLWSAGRENEVAFSYSCCAEKIKWQKWKQGWRTKIVKKDGRQVFEWVKTQKADSSISNFRSYLQNVMNYAGTLSLSRDMKAAEVSKMEIGDVFVQGGAPGYGHGVIIVDMAVSPSGKKIALLAQSYNPAENFNVLKSGGKYSPWFELDFNTQLVTPQWLFTKEHAKKFE